MYFVTLATVIDSKEYNRRDYIARINKIIDYLSQNLEKPIDLSVMSDIASFSSYYLWLTESGYQPKDSFTYELYHNSYSDKTSLKETLKLAKPDQII